MGLTTASVTAEKRILLTYCVADAYAQLHAEDNGDLIRKAFLQNGIALAIDGSQDHLVKVRDIPDIGLEIIDAEGEWRKGRINTNLTPASLYPGAAMGKKIQRWAGKGLVEEDNWDEVLRLLDEKEELSPAGRAKHKVEMLNKKATPKKRGNAGQSSLG